MGTTVVGRQVEVSAVADLIGAVADGPAALVLEGEPGIGKTTVWRVGVRRARDTGLRLLVCQGASAEVRLAYAALTDLLADVGEQPLGELPAPQRHALRAALLRAEPLHEAPPDPRSVATALLSLLERLSGDGPLLIAIDELQWLDRASARALRFALRRLRGRVGLLAVQRFPPSPPAETELSLRDPQRLRVLRLGPLSREEIRELVRQGAGRLSSSDLARIDRIAAGNPFVALELARALAGGADVEMLPESLRELVAARLADLQADVRQALLLAAALTRPRVAVIQRALGAGDAGELLGRAEAAEIVALRFGRVAFTHPLLSSGVYAAATAPQRRAAHRRLVDAVEDVEERARHLALASLVAEPEVTGALDAAAAHARARGAPADAAELLELAVALGADDPERLLAAAECHLVAGDVPQAEALAARSADALTPGPQRGRALALQGAIRHRDSSYAEAATLLSRALGEVAGGAPRVMLALVLAYVHTNCGHLREARRLAVAAVAEASGLGDPGTLAEAVAVQTMVRFLLGEGVDEDSLVRAVALEDPDRPTPVMLTPSMIAGDIWGWTGRFDDGLAALERARRRCLDRGAETDVVHMTAYGVRIWCGAGKLDRAREIVADTTERAAALGTAAAQAVALGNQAMLAGWTGRTDEARSCARASLELFQSIGAPGEALMTVEALGRLELSVGRHAAAADALLPALEAVRAMGAGEPALPQLAPDAIEALVALGRLEEARTLVSWLGQRSRRLARPSLAAIAARCHGLFLAGDGELESAQDALDAALAAHRRQPIAYDHARTLLIAGQIQRRLRRRRAARQSLEQARETFAALGASPWVAQCEAELSRLGLRRSTVPDALTPSEWRIAELAASGATNREVAAAMFVSPKTVEATLARAYRKLGIHSRAELGQRMGSGHGGATPDDAAADRVPVAQPPLTGGGRRA